MIFRSAVSRISIAAAAAVFTGTLVVYLLTMSRSVGWHDSAELALVAAKLGASHSPGSPLHSLLGYLFSGFFADAFMATNLLSVLPAALAAGCLAALLVMLSGDVIISMAAAFVYAFSYQVWTGAVATEIYALSMLFLAAALLFAWLWTSKGHRVYCTLMSVAYAFALAAYFANILLLPAFLYVAYSGSSQGRPGAVMAAGTVAWITALAILLIGAANFLLARNLSPFGQVMPDSLGNVILYMSGSQHGPLQIRDFSFLAERVTSHIGIFTRSFFYVGIPLGLVGAWRLLQLRRVYGAFMLLVFLIYMAYYTIFGPGDYFMMVLPAYFVFAIWIGQGAAWLRELCARQSLAMACSLLPWVLAATILAVQFDFRRAMSRAQEAEKFVAATSALIPGDALVIAGFREFAVLNYFQLVRGANPGHRYVLPATSLRHYPTGTVANYLDSIDQFLCRLPVYTNKVRPELENSYRLEPAAPGSKWRRIIADSCDAES